jgi:hypothetical protein
VPQAILLILATPSCGFVGKISNKKGQSITNDLPCTSSNFPPSGKPRRYGNSEKDYNNNILIVFLSHLLIVKFSCKTFYRNTVTAKSPSMQHGHDKDYQTCVYITVCD